MEVEEEGFTGRGTLLIDRDGGRGVGGSEVVVLALGSSRETRDATELPNARHLLSAPSEDLVWVALVADIPDQSIKGRVKDMMDGNRELNRAEV